MRKVAIGIGEWVWFAYCVLGYYACLLAGVFIGSNLFKQVMTNLFIPWTTQNTLPNWMYGITGCSIIFGLFVLFGLSVIWLNPLIELSMKKYNLKRKTK